MMHQTQEERLKSIKLAYEMGWTQGSLELPPQFREHDPYYNTLSEEQQNAFEIAKHEAHLQGLYQQQKRLDALQQIRTAREGCKKGMEINRNR
jgi:hypothetical protein